MSRRAVLVTDGEQRASLALVRSLGRAGYEVYVCAPRARSLAGSSRYVRATATAADPLHAPEQFLRDVISLVQRWRVHFLVPVSEGALRVLLPARGSLGNVIIPFADADTFARISDKALLLEAAPRYGVAVPRQRVAATREDALALLAGPLEYPLVIKPARSVVDDGARRRKTSVAYAGDRVAAEAELARMGNAAYPVLFQQRIVGPGVGIFLLVWDGRPVAVFSHRRIREKPPSGGVSVYRESIPADETLVSRSLALLGHFGWRGVAMIEYKLDAVSGTPYLMEINGRFWGSLQLAIDAGVDFPSLLLRAASGERVGAMGAYDTGVRSRWWWGDVDHLIARLRRSDAELALPPGAPSRWRTVRDVLTPWRRGDRNEVLRRDDPAPFLHETVEWLRGR
ncbi:MAG: ATP-grasp domain-containing protein [Gemmatimonadaceae bacterium]